MKFMLVFVYVGVPMVPSLGPRGLWVGWRLRYGLLWFVC